LTTAVNHNLSYSVFIMPTTSSPTKISLYSIVIAVICFAAVFPVPTHSFTSSPTPSAAASLRRHYSQKVVIPNDAFTTVSKKMPLSVNTLLLSEKKNEEGGEKWQFDDQGLFAEKNIPGLVFTTILTLWHFWIGPALKPIILEMQQQR